MKAQTENLTNKRVSIETEKQNFEGIVLESYDANIILVKLNSGYNVGIEKNKIRKINILKQEKKEKVLVRDIKTEKTAKDEVAIIVTGGTISSRLDYESGAVKPLTKPEDVIAIAPKINDIAKPVIESPFMVFSENMNHEHWKKLALSVEKFMNKPNIKGIVILCGTDTLHYVSSALSFMLKDVSKPCVLTYSQRSIDRGSSDSALNLTCAVYAALSDIAEVCIVGHATSNDNFCFCLKGTKVRKMHSSRRDAFRPINTKPLAIIYEDGRIEKTSEYKKRSNAKAKAEAYFDDKTALIKWHPNSTPDIIDFFIEKGYKGMIIEAVGMGHVCADGKLSWLEKIKKAVKKGIVVCFAPQTIYGSVNPHVYSTARELEKAGVIYLKDILPETAYVKLGFLLGKEKNIENVRKLMLENLSGEFNERISERDFLV